MTVPPALLLLQFCNRNGTPQQFVSGERPIWAVSPSYYHYLGCQCASGFTARRELAWHGDVMVGCVLDAVVCRRQYASCSCVLPAIACPCDIVRQQQC
jgi:hypothetical protein